MFTKRSLRSKSHTVSYTDEQPGGRKYDILERLADPKFCVRHNYVREMQPGELTLQFVQEHGLTQPLVLHSYDGLGMRLPPRGFSVQDVKKHVGARRVLDVIDCNTQESLTMSLGAWVRYYQSAPRERTLNVISLEFSRTSMDSLVEPPSVVKQLDWVELIWPRNLKDQQTDPTNDITKMMYPKVQKYCLMSIGGCYTDFHLDFGGTSVWYHVFEGEKIFLLVPPTPQNYQAFHTWQRTGQQDAVFFPDTVLTCEAVQLKMGDTFFLPSGWIHAVYTQQDSLVFGGNFLHTSNIPAQLKVKEMEDMLKVPEKFRYPFYSRVHWYVLVAYSNRLEELGLGTEGEELHIEGEELIGSVVSSPPQYKGHMTGQPAAVPSEIMSSAKPYSAHTSKPYFPHSECEGLLHLLHSMRRDGLFFDDVPPCVHSVAELMERLEAQLSSLELCTAFSSTPNGVAVITPTWVSQAKPLITSPRCTPKTSVPIELTLTSPPQHNVEENLCKSAAHSSSPSRVVRSRRRRCLACAACQRAPCGSCRHCLDSPKFGGPGLLKQSCVLRKCQQLRQECVTMETNHEPHPAIASVVPPEEAVGTMEDTNYTVLIEVVMNPHQCMCQEEEDEDPLSSSPEKANPLTTRLEMEHVYSEDTYKPSAKDTYRPLTADTLVGSRDSGDLSQIVSTQCCTHEGALLARGLEEVIILEPHN